jgi:hypothetical protein
MVTSLPVKSPRVGHLQASLCTNATGAAHPHLSPIRSNGAFDGDRLRQGGGGPYGLTANAIDLACPG